MKPITPDEGVTQKNKLIPKYVIECFNMAIAKHWNGHSSTIFQHEIVNDICIAGPVNSRDVFARHYLDVECIFREAGWDVEYDKPGFNETYNAKFVFRKRK